MKTCAALLAICEVNPAHKANDAEFWCFFDLNLNKRLSKQSGRRLFETPSRSLWRHCNDHEITAITGNIHERLLSKRELETGHVFTQTPDEKMNWKRTVNMYSTTHFFHRVYNALDRYPRMHHFATEMCTFLLQYGALWSMGLVDCVYFVHPYGHVTYFLRNLESLKSSNFK